MSHHKHSKSEINERTPFDELPTYLTPYEVARITRRSRASVYKGIARGAIPSIRVGERGFLVPSTHFRELWEGTAKEHLLREAVQQLDERP